MRFRKKPVEIKAVQFNGSLESYRNIVHTLQIPENEIVFDSFNMEINIQTLEGIHIASHGDWIIKGVKGEFYPCKPDIFDLTYEEVDNTIHYCSTCGKEMEQVDTCLWVCPDYPHNTDNICPGCMKPKELCTMETTGCIGNR